METGDTQTTQETQDVVVLMARLIARHLYEMKGKSRRITLNIQI